MSMDRNFSVKEIFNQANKQAAFSKNNADIPIFATLYRLFPTVLVDKLAGCYSNMRNSDKVKNSYEQLKNVVSTEMTLELLIVLIKMLELSENNAEAILNMNKQLNINAYNFNLLNQQAFSLNKSLEWNPNRSILGQNVNHANMQNQTYQLRPRPAWPNGGPFKITKVERPQSPYRDMFNKRYEPVSPRTTPNVPTTIAEIINEKGSDSSKQEKSLKKPEVSDFADSVYVNPNQKFKNNKVVKAIRKLVQKGMTEDQIEELGDYILNPEKNLRIIKRFLVDDEWDTYKLDELTLLLYKSSNVGFYLCFRPNEKDWNFNNRLIKN
jgi:hypothetical protein